jgi:RNA recognition motif-containing protein
MEDTKEQEEDKLDFYGDLFRNAPEIPNNEETEETANHGLQQSENLENLADATLDPSKNTVSVSGLGWWFTDEELEHVACESSQGTSLRKTLKEVKFCYDSANGKSTGEAFLIFDNATTAQEALKNLESHDFGRKVKLELTTEEVAQQETDWALKKSLNRNSHNRQHFQGRRNPLQKGAFEQSYRGQGATGPFPGNAAAAAHFAAAAAAAQKFPHSQTATMSAPPAFPFFTPFGFPAFPGRASNSNSMAANTAFANNNSQSNNNSNMPTGRTSQPESSSFFPPGFPPIPPHLFGYPPLAGMPPGSGFPGSFTSASAATGPFGNSPLNVPDASAVQVSNSCIVLFTVLMYWIYSQICLFHLLRADTPEIKRRKKEVDIHHQKFIPKVVKQELSKMHRNDVQVEILPRAKNQVATPAVDQTVIPRDTVATKRSEAVTAAIRKTIRRDVIVRVDANIVELTILEIGTKGLPSEVLMKNVEKEEDRVLCVSNCTIFFYSSNNNLTRNKAPSWKASKLVMAAAHNIQF